MLKKIGFKIFCIEKFCIKKFRVKNNPPLLKFCKILSKKIMNKLFGRLGNFIIFGKLPKKKFENYLKKMIQKRRQY